MLPLLLLAAEAVTPQPPKIDPALAAQFWKAQAEAFQARLAAIEKDQAAQQAAAKLSCGAGYAPVASPSAPAGIECKKQEAPKK
jgi:hypothetical protein